MDLLSTVETQENDHTEQSKYSLLGAYLQTPVVHYRELPRLIEHARHTEHESELLSGSFCVLFEIDQSKNTLFRVSHLVLHLLQIRSARKQFFRLTGTNPGLVGVYPSIANPTLVFELETPAAEYVKNHVLPRPQNQPSAFIKSTMEKLLKVNPGVAALGIIVRLR